ncbi:hypothetical protein EDD86DRAFT_196393 [Gorgonomyces haynaldii]|nr:hypothetical protein EDD86DRAFT_196393 [Gorgonomyces haynaldii]
MFVQTIISIVAALPNGAPRCQINPQGIQQGHGSAPDQTLGYSITAAKEGNGMKFSIANSAGLTSFKGALMYVASAAAPKVHLGKFTNLDTTKFKFQDPNICQTAGVQGAPEAVFTHANPSDKPLTTTFTWEGSAEEMAKADLTLFAVLAAEPGKAQGGRPGTPRWEPITLPLNGGQAPTAPGAPAGPAPAVQKVIKCMPKNLAAAAGIKV